MEGIAIGPDGGERVRRHRVLAELPELEVIELTFAPDFAAWTSSFEHIAATPGFEGRRWPHAMTVEENRGELERHAADFAARSGFTYAVRDPDDGAIVGCVYVYPAEDDEHDASARSWVRADRADLDEPLWRAVSEWLGAEGPFGGVADPARPWPAAGPERPVASPASPPG